MIFKQLEPVTRLALCSMVLLLFCGSGGIALLATMACFLGIAIRSWAGAHLWVPGDHRYCGACGYDLTGVPSLPATRCPECGKEYDEAGVQTFFPTPLAGKVDALGLGFEVLPAAMLILSLYNTLRR